MAEPSLRKESSATSHTLAPPPKVAKDNAVRRMIGRDQDSSSGKKQEAANRTWFSAGVRLKSFDFFTRKRRHVFDFFLFFRRGDLSSARAGRVVDGEL